MLILESIRMALSAIITHKLRSFLTLLGVIIGVMTIIGMMTVIRGLQLQIEKQMTQLTTDVFQLQRFDSGISFDGDRRDRTRPKLTLEEAEAIAEHCPSVSLVGPEVWKFGQWVTRGKERTNPNMVIAGGYPEFAPNNGYSIDKGRFISYDDVEHSRRIVVIGSDLVKKLFPFDDPLDKQIRLGTGRFRVVGVFEEMGSSFGNTRDNRVVMPFSTFQNLYGKRRSINVTVKAKSSEVFEQAKEEVIALMRNMRGLKSHEPNNFAIWSPDNLIDDFNQMTFWVKVAAIGICAISLLVAGIGIMNIMLVSVTERTREIGVRMAIGAKKVNILWQFLVEAVILSEVGGIIGVVIGIILPIWAGKAFNIPAAVPLWAIVLGLVFCSFVGIVFGLWPALRAAKLDPVEALRCE
ncbi:peptide ABC transporter permease [candidate division LCP-89 bacterium B3_LCP]|uniref:Peptide ABC transporter permease n=1 Tax=candidate division LCP-89 bacterium B3_LCP TaxID=2012998 RepID=A0A532V5G5_UNCL8|nr:MAG: peptide ABC transporter permease [candidate division LCP-89 bacterium B3_LCP]